MTKKSKREIEQLVDDLAETLTDAPAGPIPDADEAHDHLLDCRQQAGDVLDDETLEHLHEIEADFEENGVYPDDVEQPNHTDLRPEAKQYLNIVIGQTAEAALAERGFE